FQAAVSQRLSIDEQTDLMSGIQAGGQRNALFQTELQESGIVSCVFLSAKGQVLIRRLSSDDQVPILRFDNGLQLLKAFPGGIQPAHQTAHTGSCNVVDRDVMLLEPFNYPNVSEAQRTSAFQGDSNLRPQWLSWLRRSIGQGWLILRGTSRGD